MLKCFSAYRYVQHRFVYYSWRSEDGIGSPESGVTYKWLGSAMWLLGNEPGSFERVTDALNH